MTSWLAMYWPSSLQRRARYPAYYGRGQDCPPWAGALDEFELDALKMIILLEHDRGAFWLDRARAEKRCHRIGPAPHAFQSRRYSILPVGKSIQMDAASPDLKTKLVIVAFIR